MPWQPLNITQKRAEDIKVGEIVQSTLGYWNRIIRREIDDTAKVVEWVGKHMDTGTESPMSCPIGERRTVGQ